MKAGFLLYPKLLSFFWPEKNQTDTTADTRQWTVASKGQAPRTAPWGTVNNNCLLGIEHEPSSGRRITLGASVAVCQKLSRRRQSGEINT